MTDAARRRGLLTLNAVWEVLTRFSRHPGHAPLLRVPQGLGTPTRSEFERAFIAFCRAYRLPMPLINVIVAGRERDAYFPDARLIVELDGWQYHQDHRAFTDDRERDTDALEHGIVTVRITWEPLIERPGREATRLQRILENRRCETASHGSEPDRRSARDART